MMQDFNTKRKYILKIICIICLCAFSHIDSRTSVRNMITTDIREQVLTVEEKGTNLELCEEWSQIPMFKSEKLQNFHLLNHI